MDLQRPQGDAFTAARDEVGWFYAASSAAMGLHGQGYGDGGGTGIWDEAKSTRAHLSRRTAGHRADVARHKSVAGTLAQLDPELRVDLESVYVPFGASRTTWQAYSAFTQGRRPLLGLALRTKAISEAFKRSRPDADAEPTFGALLRWVEDEVADLKPSKRMRQGYALPDRHQLLPALREAEGRELTAIRSYDELRLARILAAQRQRSAPVVVDDRAAEERRQQRLAPCLRGLSDLREEARAAAERAELQALWGRS